MPDCRGGIQMAEFWEKTQVHLTITRELLTNTKKTLNCPFLQIEFNAKLPKHYKAT